MRWTLKPAGATDLRDEFAKAALPALIAKAEPLAEPLAALAETYGQSLAALADSIAECAYIIADAMLKARGE